ncbi:MAG: hypothetical protein QGH00_05205, partial [Candidatus Poseidoniia archaeon]|nr:hypothetical protein [Candidatus Poseidoniia archaeon]
RRPGLLLYLSRMILDMVVHFWNLPEGVNASEIGDFVDGKSNPITPRWCRNQPEVSQQACGGPLGRN